MAFATLEESVYLGQPLELYEFALESAGGTTLYWRYNTSDRGLTYSGNFYKAVTIANDGARLSGEAVSTEYRVTMPVAEDFVQRFRLQGTTPSAPTFLRVRRAHGPDIAGLNGPTPTVTSAVIVWIGTVSGVTQIDEISARVSAYMLPASFRRGGLRYGYQRNCPHVLYAPNTCRVDKAAFRTMGTITTIDGVTVTATAFDALDDGWFDGGIFEYALTDGSMERRMILVHTGGSLRLAGTPAGLVVGQTAHAYPGCDLRVGTCIDKFDNQLNFGGFTGLPGRNPFDGQPLF